MSHLKGVRAEFLFGLGQNGKKLIIFKNFTLVSQSWSHKTGSNIACLSNRLKTKMLFKDTICISDVSMDVL